MNWEDSHQLDAVAVADRGDTLDFTENLPF